MLYYIIFPSILAIILGVPAIIMSVLLSWTLDLIINII